MGFGSTMKLIKAANLQKKGQLEEAKALYAEAYEAGEADARSMLAYALLLLRSGEYQKAKDVTVKCQKLPMTDDQKNQLYIDYAVACMKLGDLDKGLGVLERRCGKEESGLVYETLGYYYVAAYEQSRKPDVETFLRDIEPGLKEKKEEPVDPRFPVAVPLPDADGNLPEEQAPEEEPEDTRTPEQRRDDWWQSCVDKVIAYNEKALEYDDEDPICLDNMAQTYYRVVGDKEKAKEYFDKALALKPGQIDTLWFLSRYDVESGDKAAAIEKLEKAMTGRFSPLNYLTREEMEAELKKLKA